MENSAGYARFFSYLSLFTFSMLVIVFAQNFLVIFVGWELVGLSSYLLIGFWINKRAKPEEDRLSPPVQPSRPLSPTVSVTWASSSVS